MPRVDVSAIKKQARKITASALVIAALAVLYATDNPGVASIQDAAAQFAFSRHRLPELPGPPVREFRNTHPDVRHIAWFMSTVGAAAALNDLDGDGLANDVCYIDTRTDQVIVAPVPGTGDRYKPFALDFDAGGKKLF